MKRFAFALGAVLSGVILAATFAVAEGTPKLYPDSEDLSGGGTITGDLTLQSVDPGSAADPQMSLDRNSPSPADYDYLGDVVWLGNDDALANQTYARIAAVASDVSAGTSDGMLYFFVPWADIELAAMRLGSDGTNIRTDIQSQNDGATADPILRFRRLSSSPAASDVLGQIMFEGYDSGPATQDYGRIESVIADPTAGSEDSYLLFSAPVGGSDTPLFKIGSDGTNSGLFGRNGEYINNSADGDWCFGAVGGTTPEEVCLDMDYGGNVVALKTGSSTITQLKLGSLDANTDANYGYVLAGIHSLRPSTYQTPDAVTLSLDDTAAYGATLMLVEGTSWFQDDFAFSDQANPTLVWQSACTPGACSAQDKLERIWIQHDGTDGKITVDSGALVHNSPTVTVADDAADTVVRGWAFNQTLADFPADADANDRYDGLKINLTTPGSMAGWDGGTYAFSIYDDSALRSYISIGGTAYFHATTYVGGSGGHLGPMLIFGSSAQAGYNRSTSAGAKALNQFIDSTGYGYNYVIGAAANYQKLYDHADQTNPTLWIHSATDPDSDNTQWISMVHDQTDGVITTGKGDLVLAPASSLVAIGGTTSSYPGLKRSSAALQCRVADDTSYCDFTGATLEATASLKINGGSARLSSATDGVLTLRDTAATDFNQLEFGPAGSATFPELAVTDGATPIVTLRQSDGSGAADFRAEGFISTIETTSSARTNINTPDCEILSCDGDTSIDGADKILKGRTLLAVTTRITTALTLASGAGYSVGDGSDPDIWGVEATSTLGNGTTQEDLTAQWGNPQLAASDVHITFPDNCTEGAIRVCVHQLGATEPQS